MQTLLSRFCEEFVRILHPLLPPLARSAEAISTAPGDLPVKDLQSQLVDLRHQMELLSEKVSAQQAYVLIFGPLKSGKSTLMNAIAGSYVSEVSCLPAYPCMVFVSHAPQREFVLTRYSGTSRTFQSPVELKDSVDKAHTDLAAKIRASEKSSEGFDPRVHYQEAISRVDVKVPTAELSQSRAVLVDTPGLYSRMKFGYDRMTREFRSSAACAIFVVRSDNLFLDQVFAEFTDLLELFSRIFLVVNCDSSKQDLSPEGKLVPSLEQQNPERIIEAFQSLSMSAPLKEAADEGRLRIYPVDLLRAAGSRLSPDEEQPKDKGFQTFLDDLVEYLNSSDYLVSFLGDSLRRAGSLIDETVELCNVDAVQALREEMVTLQTKHDEEESRRQAIERLEGAGWNKRFESLGRELTKAGQDAAGDIGVKATRRIHEAVQLWFRSNDSLQKLAGDDLVEILTDYQKDLTAAVSKELSERLVKADMGIDLPEQLADALATVDIDLMAICREAHAKVDRNAMISVPAAPVRSGQFQVRKTFWDWVLFRSSAAMQRLVFGPSDKPAQAISPEVKMARLGEPARVEMRRQLEDFQRKFTNDAMDRIVNGFVKSFCRIVLDEFTRSLRRSRNRLENKVEEYRLKLEACQHVLEPLNHLKTHAEEARTAVRGLSDHYEQIDLFMLTQPVMPGYTLPSNPPGSQKTEQPSDQAAPAESTPES